MECLLCLVFEEDTTKCIQVDSMLWQELCVKNMIDKYLWCIDSMISRDCICYACWQELNDFHNFYTRIEKVHNENKLCLKIEIDPLQEDSKAQVLQEETLLEPEITIGQFVIKQESDETAAVPIDNTSKDNCNDIPDQDDDALMEDSSVASEYSNNTDSDDDVPLIQRGRKRKCSTKLGACQKDANTKANSNKSLKSKQTTKTKTKNKITNSKSYNLPKLNRVEYDKFLKEHFKFTCNKCQQTFERFRLLCQHYKKDHNEEGFAICCETKFFNRRLLVDHINYHLNPEYFKCTYCGKVFTKRICLIGHMKMHEEKTHCCDLCDRKFVLRHKLEKHKLTHLPESEKKFPCNECGKFYANEYILTQHQRAVHLNVYAKICEICGQTMPDSHTFKRHMEKHNGIPPPASVKCEICGLIVTCQRSLSLHKELKHPVDGSREYNCHICMKVSPNMRALKKHIREAHEIGYQYKCTVCTKEFKRADNFKSHMAMHTGTPLYRCPWCPKEFNSNGNMHQHRKKAHPLEWEEAQRKKYSGNLPPNYKRHYTYSS